MSYKQVYPPQQTENGKQNLENKFEKGVGKQAGKETLGDTL